MQQLLHPAQEEKKAAPAAAAAAKEVNVPDIGGDEVEVTEILVKVGDTVAAEQSLITVEGDKASMEVPAPFAGTVKEIKINTGDKVSTGSLIMVLRSGRVLHLLLRLHRQLLRRPRLQLLLAARKTLTYQTSAVTKLK